MAIFISEAELQRAGTDVGVVVARAEAFIVDLQQQLETQRARADAAAISVEQTCGLIEQKFLSLTEQYAQLEQQKEQTTATLDRRSAELAQAQAHTHRLELEAIKRDGEVERLSFELGELRKAKRELLDVVDHKNAELDEKNSSIKTYLDKIVALTDDRSMSESKSHEHEAELSRLRALQTRLAQEKELLAQHNSWLSEELTAKVSALLEERRNSAETEAGLRSKLAEAERLVEELGEASRRNADRNKELDAKLSQLREELKFAKEDASARVDHLSAEIATATKLAELYKESSEEWSKKSHDLEGVISALEAHLNEVESDYKDKLEQEMKVREEAEKEAVSLKEQIARVTSHHGEIKEDSLALAPVSIPLAQITNDRQLALEVHGDGLGLPPGLPLSGTALAASLLRDGWTLATIYSKYQEAVDKWRHEKQERHHSQSLLERVLHEIESKAEVIMDERAEHERMIRAYRVMEEKLCKSMSDQVSLDNVIKDLKVELRKRDRELKASAKEVLDLQTQVAVLLKEGSDIERRTGIREEFHQNGHAGMQTGVLGPEATAVDAVISHRLLAFKDIRSMVEHNSQLRTLVRTLAAENEQKEALFKETFEMELKKRTEKLVQKVSETVERQEEQLQMVETLQATVRMYKRLHDEANATRLSSHSPVLSLADGGEDVRRVLGSNQEEIQKLQKEGADRIRGLEAELNVAKQEVVNLRVEQARADGAGCYAKEQLEALMKDFESQRREMEALLRRNMEYSQTITDYQRKLREHAQNVQAAEENARKFSIEVSVLNREKELLASAEKRASDEVASLSDRVHRLQATLDTVESVKAFQENIRIDEVKRLETELNRMQKEWTEARRELESERLRVGNITVQRDQSVNQALDRVEAVRKELTDAMKAVSTAETRAQVAEARCADLEISLKKAEEKVAAFVRGKPHEADDGTSSADEEVIVSLQQAREELDKLKEDLAASQSHTDQYKRIATANGEALKQMEIAHNAFKDEADRVKAAQEMEITSLRKKLVELEADSVQKEKAAAEAVQEKGAELSASLSQLASLKEAFNSKQCALTDAEDRIVILKKDIEKLHHQWREAQSNYERQVLLQADTIRELTAASEKLMQFEDELRLLRARSEVAEADLESSKVSWQMERETFSSSKVDLESKLRELNEQNQLLLDRLEARHIIAADQAQKGSADIRDQDDAVQSVIRFLRRSKETSDTELSLMKQERLRLQKQLEAALRAAEEAHTSLRREHESARASLHTEQDMKSLQAQVHELALLRESNAQLREENKKNFEDSKESREKASKAQADFEVVQKRLREFEVDLEAAGKELEVQKAETLRWQSRVSQLLEKYKSVDVEDYQQVKAQLAEFQAELRGVQSELLEARKAASEARERASQLEQDIAAKDLKLSELERRVQELSQSEATMKTDLERFRRHALFLKKKIETLTREKDELSKENENLVKQVDESKANSGRKSGGESNVAARQETAARQEQTDNVMREQDVRIQTLEKTLERERDELRKEKLKRQKDQKAFYDIAEKAVLEKKRFLEEFQNFKQDIENGTKGSGSLEPGPSSLEDRVQVYEAAVMPLSSLASGVPLETTLLQITPAVTSIAVPSEPVVGADSSFTGSVVSITVGSALSVPVATTNLEAAVVTSTVVASAMAPVTPAENSVPASTEEPADFTARGNGEHDVGVPSQSSSPAATASLAAGTAIQLPGNSNVGTEIQPPNSVSGALLSAGSAIRPRSSHTSVPPRPPSRPPPPSAAPGQSKEELDLKIQQLRAHLLEKEKAQAQARKMTRKLIRPRIEPEVQTEVPESSTEGQPDPQEMETDAPENRTVAALQDGFDASLGGTENLTDASGGVGEQTIIMSESISSSVLAVGTSAGRKRSEGPSDEQDLISETVPPLKKARPVDVSQVGRVPSSQVLDLATASASNLEGPVGSLESLREDVQAIPPSYAIVVSDTKPVYPEPTFPVNSDTTKIQSVFDSERERPIAEVVDHPAPKKPRFTRPDSSLSKEESQLTLSKSSPSEELIPTSPPEEVGLAGDREDLRQVQPVESPRADVVNGSVPILVETAAVERVSESADGIASNLAPDGSTSQDTAMDICAKDSKEMLVAAEALRPADLSYGKPPGDSEGIAGNLQLMVVLTSAEGVPKPSLSKDVEETETLTSDIADDKTVGYQDVSERTGAPDRDEDAEDGEIMTEVMENAEFTGFMEGVNIVQQETSMEDTQAQPLAEALVTVEGDTPSGSNAAEAMSSRADMRVKQPTGTTGNLEAGQIPSQGEHSDPPRPATHAPKGTTINLAERARERAVLRRQVISPPSPGTRGGRGRGTKRASGPGRGRLISTGVRNQGQPAGDSAQGASHSEAPPTMPPSNPYEALKDDQE